MAEHTVTQHPGFRETGAKQDPDGLGTLPMGTGQPSCGDIPGPRFAARSPPTLLSQETPGKAVMYLQGAGRFPSSRGIKVCNHAGNFN